MGKKIRGKKHRGVKDPYKQAEERLDKIRHKINAKPSSIEAQEIPKSVQAIARFNDKFKKNKKKTTLIPDVNKKNKLKQKTKKKKKNKDLIDGRKFVDREWEEPGMTRPTKLVPLFQQHPQETDRKFLKRVSRVTSEIMKEAAFEDKYKVEVQRNEAGQVVSIQHYDKIDPLLSDKQKKKVAEREEKKRAARRERDKRRRGKKRKNDDDDDDEFSYYEDKVSFGEVVYEPPTLHTKKLMRRTGGVTKAKSFLFMDKLKSQDKDEPSTLPSCSPSTSSKPGKKATTPGAKRIVQQERERVMEAYRQMKERKYVL